MRFDFYYLAGVELVELRELVAEQFRKLFAPIWHLHFIDSAEHIDALSTGVDDDSYMVIAEAGVVFNTRTPDTLRRCVDNLVGKQWDIVYAEIEFTNSEDIIKLFPPKNEMLRLNNLQLHYLKKIAYSGARFYIVNKWAKHKVLAYVQTRSSDLPYDAHLRKAIQADELRAFVIFPFATATAEALPVSEEVPEAAASAYRDAETVEAEWNTLFQ